MVGVGLGGGGGGRGGNKKNTINLSSAELAQRVVIVNHLQLLNNDIIAVYLSVRLS